MKKPFSFLLLGLLLPGYGIFAQVPVAQPSAEEVALVVSGNTLFALDLYRTMSSSGDSKGKNIFFSPVSLSTAMAMTYAGARKETAAQMARVFHFALTQARLHPAFGVLISDMQDRKGYQLSVANALWPQKGYPFLKEFMDIETAYYKSGVQTVDYKKNAEGAREIINRWAAEKTQNKITNVIPSGVLNQYTRLVLTNAVYFKGNWAIPFHLGATSLKPFTTRNGARVQVPMMALSGSSFGYYEGERMQVLDLPYRGGDVSMSVILPSLGIGIEEAEAMLSPETLQKWVSSLRSSKVNVYFPKFRISCMYGLSQMLGQMGMPDAFAKFRANFSGMNGNDSLYLNAIFHQAYVEVDEKGTIAAAVTVVGTDISELSPLRPIPEFRADRPFLFLIRARKTGNIMFLGRIMNPMEE